MSTAGVPTSYVPARVVELELSGPLPDLVEQAGRPGPVLGVVRLCGVPLGMVALPGSLSAAEVALRIGAALGDLSRSEGHGPLPPLGASGLPHDACPLLAARALLFRSAPGISVVLCTRNRSEELARCLTSLLALEHPAYELLVVDNAPSDDASRRVCEAFAERLPLRYLVEPEPGLSRARNTGVAAAAYDVVAFVDDDERVDRGWLLGLTAEFEDLSVGAVSGPVLPAELETPAQAQFEQFGGHSKGRGFTRAVFDRRHGQSPMYPLPPFGVGANMAFRRSALRQAGGFDTALGAGTPSGGAEDTAAFTEVMLAGWTMVYTPAAITWHYHRRDDAALRQQLHGYGTGLGAYYVALLRRDPRRVGRLALLVPQAVRDVLGPGSARNASLAELPPDLAQSTLRPVLSGVGAYVRGRRVRPAAA